MGFSDFFKKRFRKEKQSKEQPDEQSQPQAEDTAKAEGSEIAPWAKRKGKNAPIEKLQEGFDSLIDKLQGINEHLDKTVSQQNELMHRIEKLPGILENFPSYAESQKQTNQELLEYLKSSSAKDEQLIQAVEKLPAQANRQSEALGDINRQLSEVADCDRQMNESFSQFRSAVDHLNENTSSQTKSIEHINDSLATSNQDLKKLLESQNRQFLWIFLTALGICVIVILVLAGTIVYLGRG